ncbi:CPBP family intramembrane glutamic endopeptidase [Reinekea blandensis]|uniref:CAAX prenyl protease 2/Lysostaphin resistance protein A-like domain-containing protein n=1 Tax=Reinekea blandensis MED297 TaxID=314283 RepID=A4BI32_9GAMM|nr:CPBP family intramembrane glutamic endopeptidase [Reinekea blandensis]EAR08175.1 hypothetical protein MED297_14590 [Reinekea sp. MED297] [Reinekea blandensis MED297]
MTLNSSRGSPAFKKTLALLGFLLIAPVPTLGVWFAAFESSDSYGAVLWVAAKVWLLFVPVLWWRWVQKQPIAVPAPSRRALTWGAGSGFLMAVGIFGAYWLLARPVIDFTALAGLMASFSLDSVWTYLGLVVYLTLVNSLVEEYVFRWFMQVQLNALMPAIAAAAGSAAVFTLHHTVVLAAYIPWGFNVLASLGIFLGAMIWSWMYRKTENLWSAYISHIGADIGVFAIGYHVLFVAGSA